MEENSETGVLTVTSIKYDGVDSLTVKNTYSAKGELDLSASKTLKNAILKSDVFTLTLSGDGITSQKKDVTVKGVLGGKVDFDPITYTLSDVGKTYVYEVKENQGSKSGIQYDSTVYKVTVNPTDEGNGKIKPNPVYTKSVDGGSTYSDATKDIVFNNIYSAEGELSLAASKGLSGRKLGKNEFSFILSGYKADSKAKFADENDGSVVFDKIKYDQDDLAKSPYTYTIKEVIPEGAVKNQDGKYVLNGVTYDSTVYTVSVALSSLDADGNATNKIVATPTYYKGTDIVDSAKVNGATFNNVYSAKGSIELKAHKSLTLNGVKDSPLKGGEYTFQLFDANGKKIDEQTNGADGSVTFKELTYDESNLIDGKGTVKYQIKEVKGSDTACTYDTHTENVTVSLEDKKDGTIKPTAKYAESSTILNPADAAEFVNDIEYVNLSATKSFSGNQLAKINTVELQLLANGEGLDKFGITYDNNGIVTLKAAAGADSDGYYHWNSSELNASWKNLPKNTYDADGKATPITYSVRENNGNNSVYKVFYNGKEASSDNGSATFDKDGKATVTNCEYIVISGKKTWDDNDDPGNARPSSIRVYLVRDGKDYTDSNGNKVYATASKQFNWTYKFTGLPKFDENDLTHEYKYTVRETDADGNDIKGYDVSYSGYNITNKIQTTSISVNKVWNDNNNQDGKRPINITVQLRANGSDYLSAMVLSADNNWSNTWNDLPTYINGNKVTYTVVETSNPGEYAASISQNGNQYTITNTYTPEFTSRTVLKTWDDQGNADGTRPAAITVRLYADGVQYRTATVTALSGWAYTFTNLPLKKNGNTINYTISEDAVAGYTTTVSGMTVVNSHTPTTPPPTPTPPETPPTATTPVDVLGARRTKTGSGSVLGARRSPQTGDTANAGIWALLMGASAALAAVWATLRKKLKGDDEQN